LNDGSLHGLDEFLTNLNLERGSVNRNNKNKFPGGGKKNGYWLNDILVDVLKDNIQQMVLSFMEDYQPRGLSQGSF
jgi:hypothetical protein